MSSNSHGLNGVELGAHLGIKKSRVSQLKKDGVFRWNLYKKYDLEECKKAYKDHLMNADRPDREQTLPFDSPIAPSAAAKSFVEEVSRLKEGDAERAAPSARDKYMTSKAVSATIKAQKDVDEYDLYRKKLCDTVIHNEIMKQSTLKNNAAIKTVLISLPKRMALDHPNPKDRPIIETHCNKHIRAALTVLSKINPANIPGTMEHIHDYDTVIKSMRKKT